MRAKLVAVLTFIVIMALSAGLMWYGGADITERSVDHAIILMLAMVVSSVLAVSAYIGVREDLW